MKSADIREAFLTFFEKKQHQRVDSSSLVPGNDPTLLFTNAGMVQFKDVFLGSDPRSYTRATSSQRCVRAGGKHNDLENVGYTARHHTFFEMLGNFSFGDYFKEDAIRYAWEFLTSKACMGLPEEKLTVTVYADDDEAFDIWQNIIGVPADRIIRIGDNKGQKYASDNFWAMGDTGPCGPSTEIFYDHGADIWGGLPGTPEEDGDRFIEIWNVVFMQYERSADGTMNLLPKPSVDTGMGLERISAIMQGVHNNYEIDLFQSLLKAVDAITKTGDLSNQSLRVIADHIRSCSFLIVDDVIPANEGRGYVLRRIIRRAIRHAHKLGVTEPFFYKLAKPLAAEMGDAFPELVAALPQIEKVLLAEEEQFAKTLDNGMQMLNIALDDLQGDTLSGELIFKLYDTYGFPFDLTADIAREREIAVDEVGFKAAMAEQRKRSQAAGSFSVDYTKQFKLEGETQFTGYSELAGQSEIVALFVGEEAVNTLKAEQQGVVVLNTTPFYAESGGQIGDTGSLSSASAKADVTDVIKASNHHLHQVTLLEGELTVGDQVDAVVNNQVRKNIELNHSATHLLHAALREVLGDHVQQKGSLNTSERLRFDFSHFEGLTQAELLAIEDLVNIQIRNNSVVETLLTDMETAKAKGAMALFGEKYGDDVRLLTMGSGFSVELCGGTHVERTGDIGQMRIVSESSVAAGVRRIEAVTGQGALNFDRANEQSLRAVATQLKAKPETLEAKLQVLVAQAKKQEKEIQQLKAKLATSSGGDLSQNAVEVAGIKVLAATIEGADRQSLLATLDQLKNKLGSAVVLLASVDDKGIALVAGVTKDSIGKIKAGDIIKEMSGRLGGKGGGRPDMAQGGGVNEEELPAIIGGFSAWVQAQIS